MDWIKFTERRAAERDDNTIRIQKDFIFIFTLFMSWKKIRKKEIWKIHPVSIRKTFLLVKLLSKKLDRISLDSFPGAAESIEISQPN